MLIPILCITCGSPIGDKEELFIRLKYEKIKKMLADKNIDIDSAPYAKDLQIGCDDILDQLHINKDCCRAHMISAMLFSDWY